MEDLHEISEQHCNMQSPLSSKVGTGPIDEDCALQNDETQSIIRKRWKYKLSHSNRHIDADTVTSSRCTQV